MIRIDIPEESVTVTATCPRCERPLASVRGWVSWRCDTYGCRVSLVPMWEDARFVDDAGTEWVPCDGGGWVDVVQDGAA